MDTRLSAEDLSLLREANRLAQEAERRGNLPIGAVIALDGEIIAKGMNSIWQPTIELTRHAEMEALRNVPSSLWSRSNGCLSCPQGGRTVKHAPLAATGDSSRGRWTAQPGQDERRCFILCAQSFLERIP